MAPLACASLVGLGAGVVLPLRSLYGLDAPDPHLAQLSCQSGHALTAGTSAAVALVFMALVRRLDEAVATECVVS
ncbi:hypothetical protein [Streptomyces apocyni]|uniref:hypothetical protein n=1 Tax=Streptomyces apocyni TaxID=2654677 RepID=UPI0012E9D190|nr:hypothetical protein [Streptomyces apocyni]